MARPRRGTSQSWPNGTRESSPADPEALAELFRFRDFAHFVDVYLAVVDLVRTPEDVRTLTYEVAREMAQGQQIRYAELTCTPYTTVRPHTEGKGMAIQAYTEAIEDARVAAERELGIVLRWVYDIPGESGIPAADATLDYALHHAPDALVGFGLGGPEIDVPRPQFKPHSTPPVWPGWPTRASRCPSWTSRPSCG